MTEQEAEELIGRAWPAGLSAEDEAAWASTPPDRRSQVLARLAAVLDYEEGAIKGTPAAARAGVSAATFFRLAADWRDRRSLSTLVPKVGAGGGPRHGERASVELREAARDIVASSDAGRTRESIVRELHTRFEDVAGIHLVRKVVAVEHAAARREGAAFGRMILVDSVVADIALSGRTTMRAAIDLIVDERIGIVMAATRAERDSGLEGRWRKLLAAAQEWTNDVGSGIEGTESGTPSLKIVLPDTDAASIIRHLGSLDPDRNQAFLSGKRRTGRLASAVLAGRIGRLVLRPRLDPHPTFEVRGDGFRDGPTPDPGLFDRIAAQEIGAHNARLMDAAPSAFASPRKVLRTLRGAMLPPEVE